MGVRRFQTYLFRNIFLNLQDDIVKKEMKDGEQIKGEKIKDG